MKFSPDIEQLFQQDLTTDFNIDDYHISAEVIADSVNISSNKRLTTLRIKCPRIILSEFNTHRCVVGSTKVRLSDGDSMTIESLYDEFNNHPLCKRRISCFDPETNTVRDTLIVNVAYTGVQPTIVITLGDGKMLQCTVDHKIMTRTGWIEAGDLMIDDHVMIVDYKGQIAWSNVESIIHGPDRNVYDLTVDDVNHNFIGNSIVIHNCLSRNASSSRAIPSKKLRAEVLNNMFSPIYWGANRSGMAASEQLTGWKAGAAKFVWRYAGVCAVAAHKVLETVGVHKQTCNRLIEPWLSVSIVVTSSEWENFFRLRYNKAAQPEIIVLAKRIHDAIAASEPKMLDVNGVHLPFIDDDELANLGLAKCIKISVARCCRTSYANNLGKKSQPDEDVKLFYRLLNDMHFSPFEHVAFVPRIGRLSKDKQYDLQRNFRGWYQFRSFVDNSDNMRYLTNNYNINLNEQ